MTEKNSESFPTQAQVVIIGGGVIGCHLARGGFDRQRICGRD